jgi:hemolysin D
VSQAEATIDHRQMLERALEGLPESTPEAREAVYQRAREQFVTSMRGVTSTASADVIREEMRRLKEAIEQVEAQFRATADTANSNRQPIVERQNPASDLTGGAVAVGANAGSAGQKSALPMDPSASDSRRSPALQAGTMVGGGIGFGRGGRTGFQGPDPTLPAILEFQKPSTAIVNAPMPRTARSVTWLVSSMVVTMIALAGLISVDQVVTARGIVVSRSPTILVQPLETSIVRSIDVIEGEQVNAGQLLATLDPTFTSADVGALAAQVSSLNAEAARLKAEESEKPFDYHGEEPDWLLQASLYGHRQAEFRLKMENYNHKIDELNSAISKADADITGYGTREDVAQSIEGMRKELEARKVGSRLNTLVATDARAEMQRALQSAEQELQSAKRDKAALEAERDSFAQSWSADVSQKLSEALRKLSDVREELNKAKLRRSLVELRADQDGIVQSLAKVSVGSVLQSGQPFITLIPAAAALEVEANVAGSENGFVHVDDPVSIKFDTFPFSQYGMAEGRVRTISPNSFTAQEEARNPTSSAPVTSSGEPFYRARVSLDRVALHGTRPDFRVIPGMPVTADIKVGRRTVLKYFLGRVLPIAEEGLREPQT